MMASSRATPLRTLSLGAALALAITPSGCGRTERSRAAAAPTGGAPFSVNGSSPYDGGSVVPDAGSGGGPADASTDAAAVCTPGDRSVPYSPSDPCAQGLSACPGEGWVATTTCLANGTWDPLQCACLPGPGT